MSGTERLFRIIVSAGVILAFATWMGFLAMILPPMLFLPLAVSTGAGGWILGMILGAWIFYL